MSVVTELENALVKLNKGLPAFSGKAKEFIAKYIPILTLIGGILSLLGALGLWNAVERADDYVDFANNLSRAYGGGDVVSGSLGTFGWVALVALVVQGIMYLAAYSPLKARKKQGWNLVFYAALLSLAVGVFSLFVDYLGAGGLVRSVVMSAVTFYILFQIRDRYVGGTPKVEAKTKPVAKK